MTVDLHHLAAAYALDALDADERADFEAHFPDCEICGTEVIEYRETAARLAVDPVEPPGHLRGRVLTEIARTRQLSPRAPVVDIEPRRRRVAPTGFLYGAVAAATLLIVGLIGFQLGSASPSDDQLVDLLATSDIVVEPLAGDGEAAVSVAWSAGSGEVAVVASGLDRLAGDRVYALWMLDAGGATRSVLFRPDDDGTVRELGELPGRPTGWGITVEPAGGSPQPTGEILFATAA